MSIIKEIIIQFRTDFGNSWQAGEGGGKQFPYLCVLLNAFPLSMTNLSIPKYIRKLYINFHT